MMQKMSNWTLRVKKVPNISQGSVATHIPCREISMMTFYCKFIAMFPTKKNYGNWSATGKVIGILKINFVSSGSFLAPPCTLYSIIHIPIMVFKIKLYLQ